MSKKTDLCALCTEIKDLCESHIIPKCALQELLTPTEAHGGAPRKRIYSNHGKKEWTQDAHKCYLLCVPCEDKIGVFDKYFCKNIYTKYECNEIEYTEKLYKYIISIFWRYVVFAKAQWSKTSDKCKFYEIESNLFLNIKEEKDIPYAVSMYILLEGNKYAFDLKLFSINFEGDNWTAYNRISDSSDNSLIIRRDSATNFSVIYPFPIDVKTIPLTYFNIVNDDNLNYLCIVSELFIFTLNLSEKANETFSNFIDKHGGTFYQNTIPQSINKALQTCGESFNRTTGTPTDFIETIKVYRDVLYKQGDGKHEVILPIEQSES